MPGYVLRYFNDTQVKLTNHAKCTDYTNKEILQISDFLLKLNRISQ